MRHLVHVIKANGTTLHFSLAVFRFGIASGTLEKLEGVISLVGWWFQVSTHLRNMQVKLDIFPKFLRTWPKNNKNNHPKGGISSLSMLASGTGLDKIEKPMGTDVQHLIMLIHRSDFEYAYQYRPT